jgi:hypothetical protein
MKTLILTLLTGIIITIIGVFLAYYGLVWPIVGTVAGVSLVLQSIAFVVVMLDIANN